MNFHALFTRLPTACSRSADRKAINRRYAAGQPHLAQTMLLSAARRFEMSIFRRFGSRLTLSWLPIAVCSLAVSLWTAPASAQINIDQLGKYAAHKEKLEFTVDVAEDFALFDPTNVKPTDEVPQRGSFFVTEGNIYPAHTIKGKGAEFDPNHAGSIGRWFCRGTHLVPATSIPDAPFWVDTAQLYYLPDDADSIATEGLEGGGTIVRAVTGGTGALRGYVGEQRQEFLGFNATGGVNLRVTFILRKATR
jgi:hypothetical protein